MPYRKISALPLGVKSLPVHARRIYLSAYNNAWEHYADPGKRRGRASREVTARKVAWNAVKQVYKKIGGKWTKKKGNPREIERDKKGRELLR